MYNQLNGISSLVDSLMLKNYQQPATIYDVPSMSTTTGTKRKQDTRYAPEQRILSPSSHTNPPTLATSPSTFKKQRVQAVTGTNLISPTTSSGVSFANPGSNSSAVTP